eukprot:TRINITY_DN7509_c0_g2_i1.p1 TRINITY_DN7509_c0_g2~~TRINITY_DN7509_c0_g2_i1.p1  ORF type:complete len:444 (-),score=105.78 TRINITY_DN7509_c0_g2_i1:222-1553(-)
MAGYIPGSFNLPPGWSVPATGVSTTAPGFPSAAGLLPPAGVPPGFPGIPPAAHLGAPVAYPSGSPSAGVPGLPPVGVPGLPSAGVPGLPPVGVPGLPAAGVPGLPPVGVPGLPAAGVPGLPPAHIPGLPPGYLLAGFTGVAPAGPVAAPAGLPSGVPAAFPTGILPGTIPGLSQGVPATPGFPARLSPGIPATFPLAGAPGIPAGVAASGVLPGVSAEAGDEPAAKRQRLGESSLQLSAADLPGVGDSAPQGGSGGSSGYGGALGAAGSGWPPSVAAMDPMTAQLQLQIQAAQLGAMRAAAATIQQSAELDPDEPEKEERLFGVIRDYNESQGFGFIESDVAKMRWGMDVFIHRRQMFGLSKGDEVSFVVMQNNNGRPQARSVIKRGETDKILAKRAARDQREQEKMQAKKKTSERVYTPAASEGRVMTEEEAKRFQKSLKRR